MFHVENGEIFKDDIDIILQAIRDATNNLAGCGTASDVDSTNMADTSTANATINSKLPEQSNSKTSRAKIVIPTQTSGDTAQSGPKAIRGRRKPLYPGPSAANRKSIPRPTSGRQPPVGKAAPSTSQPKVKSTTSSKSPAAACTRLSGRESAPELRSVLRRAAGELHTCLIYHSPSKYNRHL